MSRTCRHIPESAQPKPRWGYRRAHGHLRENGPIVNRKRVQRLWREEGLRVPQKTRKRRRTGILSAPISCGRWTTSTTRPATGECCGC
jgi:transposase InsO family protein